MPESSAGRRRGSALQVSARASRCPAGLLRELLAGAVFSGLVSRVEALDRLTTAPITRDVAVVQLKRALPDPLRRIELFDLVDQAVTQITDRATAEHKPVSSPPGAWADTFGSNVRGYRADSDTLLHLLVL
ncbi:hypothetical protein [Streptomyces cellulosae]|uniref:Tn3 transposase DDE domain-containing protein n=1 Tax=Streptomyces cellulosae TaxID=1968 RepID=A0ABW7YI36_STRCE